MYFYSHKSRMIFTSVNVMLSFMMIFPSKLHGATSGYMAQKENSICNLWKAIYNLKPRAWCNKRCKFVTKVNINSISNHSLYIQLSSHQSIIRLAYVNDILLTGSDPSIIEETKLYLQHKFITKDLGWQIFFRHWICL